MRLVVDALSSITGWSGTNATVYGLNDFPDYIADEYMSSLIFRFNTAGGFVRKVVNINTTGYDELVLSLYSRNRGGYNFNKESDFAYKISFGTGKEYYLPTFEGFNDVTFYIGDISNLDEIKITAINEGDDFLIVSSMKIVKDELPLDIFDGVKAGIDRELVLQYSANGILIKTGLAADEGADSINLIGCNWISRYSLIKIVQGAMSEIHYVNKFEHGKCYFGSTYNGANVVNVFTNADVYLVIPTVYGHYENEIIIPSISIWGFEPVEAKIDTKLDSVNDTFKVSGTSMMRRQGTLVDHILLIDCECRQVELLAKMAQAVRNFLNKEYVWINGKKFNVVNEMSPVEIQPTENYNIIPKIQYRTKIQVREELWQRVSLVKTQETNVNVTIH